jgi:diketogulonate reductase-like aldo/keto reductase
MANMHSPVPSLKLNDGTSMPMIAYGTGTAWSKARRPGSAVDRALVDGIKLALGMGYRHIDCAESTQTSII